MGSSKYNESFKVCNTCNVLKRNTSENFTSIKKEVNSKSIYIYSEKCKVCKKNELEDLKASSIRQDSLLCFSCNEFLPDEYFSKDKEIWNIDRRNRMSVCTKCKSKRALQIKQSLPKDQIINSVINNRISTAKLRASKVNIDFDIDYQFIKDMLYAQNFKCNISGLNMTFIIGEGKINTNMSIDKINPNLGYTKDNVHLVQWAINQMKNNLTMEELLSYAKSIVKNENKNN